MGLRLGTLNVGAFADVDGLGAAVRKHGPFDALAIQEATQELEEGEEDRLALFAEALGMRVGVACTAAFGFVNAVLVPKGVAERQISPRPAYVPPHLRRRGAPAVSEPEPEPEQKSETEPQPQPQPQAQPQAQPEPQPEPEPEAPAEPQPQPQPELEPEPEPEPAAPTMLLEPKTMAWDLDDGLAQLTQLRSHLPASLRPEAAESGQQQPMFLLGDFNALRRRDYSDEEWEALCDRRAKAQIDSPTAVTETLEAGPAAAEGGGWGLTDCRAAAAAEHRAGPTPSSVYGARVDYIWANAAAMRCWRVGRYGHVELGCGKGGQPLTDHALVVCELEPR